MSNEIEFKFWRHKYDFAEINKNNWVMVVRQYFKLDVKKITTLAMLLAVELVMVVISKFTMGYLTILGAYTIEISFFPIFFILLISNMFYTVVLSLISIWFRVILGSEIIGLISMSIIDTSFIVLFSLSFFIFKKFILFRLTKINNFKYCLLMGISVLIACILSGWIGYVCNEKFIFNLYQVPVNAKLLWVGFGITIGKFMLNFLFLLIVWKQYKIIVDTSRS